MCSDEKKGNVLSVPAVLVAKKPSHLDSHLGQMNQIKRFNLQTDQ